MNTHWQGWERRRAAVENRWRPKVFSALREQATTTAQYVRENGIVAAKLNLDYQLPLTGIHTILKALYINTGLYQANVVYGDVKTYSLKYRGFGFNEEWTKAILDYFELHLLNKAVLPITDTTKKIIRDVLDKAINEGWGAEETAKEIMKVTTDLNRKRAKVIVRTESVRAMNVGAMLGADKSSIVLEKRWVDAKDNRERESHKRNGRMKPIDMEERWPNGLAFPGDPEGSAKETINCRCTVAFVPKRDERGLVIRKPKIEPVQIVDRRVSVGASFVEGLAVGATIGSALSDVFNDL